MTTRQAFIAAAALAIAGTAGMAGWLALAPGELRGQSPVQQPAMQSAVTDSAVAETEAAVLPSPTETELGAAGTLEERSAAAPPATIPAPEWQPPARPARDPVPVRATRQTPAPGHEPEPREAFAEPERERKPARTERTEPMERPEPMELIVPANTVLGVRLATSASSETAEIEDRVEATVTRDVITNARIAVPAGARLVGSVSDVVRGGKFRETARLGVRFHTLVMDDGTRVPVRVDTILREGQAPARESAVKIGAGAVGGAIVGGILGGKKGALLGGAAGAGAGTAAVAAGDRSVAELVEGALLSVRLTSPVTVMIERR